MTNTEGQFHDTVQECYGYFGLYEMHGGGHDEELRQLLSIPKWFSLLACAGKIDVTSGVKKGKLFSDMLIQNNKQLILHHLFFCK